ncbi:tektin-3 isoform X2 [Megachile rotundata]|uniref:tektin-3 isoform X2 n=1 Tax=Megachile rotundata TaxID=143995 RepID=UPI003FD1A68A
MSKLKIEKIANNQLQSWSTDNITISRIEPSILRPVSNCISINNLIAPKIGYENTEIKSLVPESRSSYTLDTASNINSLKFPNLSTKYEHGPGYTSKNTLYSRYTPNEWFQRQVKYYNEADSCRHFSEKIRNDALRIIRDAEEKVQHRQYDTGRRLGERINDINFWKNEVASELERLVQEIVRLQDCRSVLEKAFKDIESPLHIVEECLYHREARKDTELVHDNTEKCLFKELEILEENRKQLEICIDKCKNQVKLKVLICGIFKHEFCLQLRDCRMCQCRLELDLKNKENALGIDTLCHQLNNYSHGLEYRSGIEKFDQCASEQETWMNAANQIVQKSQTERNKSCQLRTNAELLLNKVAQEMWDAWSNTNNALAHRSSELLEAKNKLQQHLQKIQQEIFDIEKNLELTRKAIIDKQYVLKVAHTRLEARMHRPDIELCRDFAHTSLQKEINEINHQIRRLHMALKELENQHQKLLRTRTTLEHDLALKIDAMYIDREKVSGLRRIYPINALFRF